MNLKVKEAVNFRHASPLPALDNRDVEERMKQLVGWELDDTRRLIKNYHFDVAARALAFVEQVGIAAEVRNHHPHVCWWKRDVRIELWTHKSNGLTTRDFEFATFLDSRHDLYSSMVQHVSNGTSPIPPRNHEASETTGQPAVLRPSQHVQYDPEKMGKSTLFETSNVIMGLNAFEPGQAHALHIHGDRDKVYYVLEGRGQFLLDSATVEIEPGIMMPAPIGVPHGIRNTGHARLVVLTVLAPGSRA